MATMAVRVRFLAPVIGTIYLLLAVFVLRKYYLWDANVYMAIALLPYVCTVEKAVYSLRFLLPCLVAVTMGLFIPVNTLMFFSLLFAALLLVENCLGKLSNMVFYLLLFLSPIFKYLGNSFGFPLRLWLSQQAVAILNAVGGDYLAEGNLIVRGGTEFSVDQACAGLNMLATSLLIGLFLLAYYGKRQHKKLSFAAVSGFMLLTVLLNIVCNMLRILLLVVLKVMPESPYHDLIGLCCLCVYVILPLYWVIKVYFERYFKEKERQGIVPMHIALRYPAVHVLLLLATAYIATQLRSFDSLQPVVHHIQLDGYKKETLENGIMKFTDRESLIYMKPSVYYAPEHDPMICWKGSGYSFGAIKKETIAGREVYTGLLSKGKEKIHAAWWFESNDIQTIHPLQWRWNALKNSKQFFLVNVNAATSTGLRATTRTVLQRSSQKSTEVKLAFPLNKQ